jgi:hypothetical protein
MSFAFVQLSTLAYITCLHDFFLGKSLFYGIFKKFLHMVFVCMQTITNDNFKAVQHRVVLNPNSSRNSIVCAITPSSDTIVSPALELVDDTHPALYHPYSYADFRFAQFQNWYTGQEGLEKFRTQLHQGGTPDQDSKSPTIGFDSPLKIIAGIKPRSQNPISIQPHQDFDFQTPILLKQGTLVA